MSEWQDMQKKPNTKLRDLLKSKLAKTRKLSELFNTEQNRLVKLKGMLTNLDVEKTCKTVGWLLGYLATWLLG